MRARAHSHHHKHTYTHTRTDTHPATPARTRTPTQPPPPKKTTPGYTYDGVLHKMGDAQWQAMLDVHVTAPMRLIQVG